jgi:hypothetical protein
MYIYKLDIRILIKIIIPKKGETNCYTITPPPLTPDHINNYVKKVLKYFQESKFLKGQRHKLKMTKSEMLDSSWQRESLAGIHNSLTVL